MASTGTIAALLHCGWQVYDVGNKDRFGTDRRAAGAVGTSQHGHKMVTVHPHREAILLIRCGSAHAHRARDRSRRTDVALDIFSYGLMRGFHT
jgi:hypothetical protein